MRILSFRLFESARKLAYAGICNEIRKQSKENEDAWHQMMDEKVRVPVEKFKQIVDGSTFTAADDGETFDEYVKTCFEEDPEAGCYMSTWEGMPCAFFQASGFEFIFK